MSLTLLFVGAAAGGGGAPAECPEGTNACNTCDPKISDTLYITVAGLPDPYASSGFNATHTVAYDAGCEWKADVGGGPHFIKLWWNATHWDIYCWDGIMDQALFIGDAGHDCAPWDATYTSTTAGTASVACTE